METSAGRNLLIAALLFLDGSQDTYRNQMWLDSTVLQIFENRSAYGGIEWIQNPMSTFNGRQLALSADFYVSNDLQACYS
ncbi:hypothetical protein OJAV_G00196010 [Oryzias javanicus]|uniref:Uncharacterized protein n=1 Tax=Oryzias javanicus TaxID=123683 RepID=A0A437C7K6_ORYJA|nr:hypothetical protein OJAV_G00196010 [Oryzias javanicus]